MPLPSFLKPKEKPTAAERKRANSDEGVVQAARTRARRRLVGAVVLLAAGVLGFPLLFETQPRQMGVDIPIELAQKDTAVTPPREVAVPEAQPVAASGVVAEAPAEPIVEPVAATPAPTPEPATTLPPSSTAHAAPVVAPAASAAAKPRPDDGQRAKSLLEGAAAAAPRPVPPASAPRVAVAAASNEPAAAPNGEARFVVQVGAYTDTIALREARQKVEKLGLKTYTQVIDTEAGKRTRVRVGPFATRDEAVAAGNRLKGAGLPANILTL